MVGFEKGGSAPNFHDSTITFSGPGRLADHGLGDPQPLHPGAIQPLMTPLWLSVGIACVLSKSTIDGTRTNHQKTKRINDCFQL